MTDRRKNDRRKQERRVEKRFMDHDRRHGDRRRTPIPDLSKPFDRKLKRIKLAVALLTGGIVILTSYLVHPQLWVLFVSTFLMLQVIL